MQLLSLCPRISREDGRVLAVTSRRVSLLALGSIFRKVIIDPKVNSISISSRSWWVIHRHLDIPFAEIQAVTYGYENQSTDQYVSYGSDSFDVFTVGLRLKDESEQPLFRFAGEGTFNNNGPYPDWFYFGDYLLDFSGSQEKESRVFVEILSRMLAVKIVPPNNY